MNSRFLASIGFLSMLLLSGCTEYQLMGSGVESGYDRNPDALTFAHPFTDKGFSDVRAEARKLCATRKKLARQAEKVCSMSKCWTTFRCEDEADILKYGYQADVVK